jgi:hypothetical protein
MRSFLFAAAALAIAVSFAVALAPEARAEPEALPQPVAFDAEDELAGGYEPPRLPIAEAPLPGQEVMIDALTGAEVLGPAPLAAAPVIAPPTDQSAPRRFLTWAGREAPDAAPALRGRSD